MWTTYIRKQKCKHILLLLRNCGANVVIQAISVDAIPPAPAPAPAPVLVMASPQMGRCNKCGISSFFGERFTSCRHCGIGIIIPALSFDNTDDECNIDEIYSDPPPDTISDVKINSILRPWQRTNEGLINSSTLELIANDSLIKMGEGNRQGYRVTYSTSGITWIPCDKVSEQIKN